MQLTIVRRLLLLVGIMALATALLLTVLPRFLHAASVVETFPLEPGVLDLPLPTVSASATPTSMPSATPTPSPVQVRTRIPSTVVLQQGLDGYQGCVDSYIQIYLPDDNFCQSPELSLGAGNKAALLLRFDLTNPPDKAIGFDSAAIVQEAKLSLYMVQGRAETVIGVYLPRREWDACTVTWNQPWQEAGADGTQDRDVQPCCEVAAERPPTWLEFDVTELVQKWLRDPDSNYGLIIKSFESRWPSQHIFFSSDHPAVNSRPKLTIKYEPSTPLRTPVPRTATPTAQVEPTATPGQQLAPRVVEVRWPNEMNVGQAYSVTLLFRPAAEQETAVASSLAYKLGVAAHLTAPSFDVVSDSPTEQLLENAQAPLSWSWTITPRIVGSQVISLDLLFAWKPAVGTSALPKVEPGVWYRTKMVAVREPLISQAQLTILRNLMAVLGLVCIVGAYVVKRREDSLRF